MSDFRDNARRARDIPIPNSERVSIFQPRQQPSLLPPSIFVGKERKVPPAVNTIDFSKLTAASAREDFYVATLSGGYNTSDPVWWSLNRMLQYISHLSWGLYETDTFDGNESVRTAADVVFVGLSHHVALGSDNPMKPAEWADPRLRGIDQLIRVAHAVEPAVQPLFHEDPLVSSFYENLGHRLEHNIPNESYAPFGGYKYLINPGDS